MAAFCPYKGLLPFAEADEPYFFGRERDSSVIASNLSTVRITVLYGTSGVGKSSVLRAGVLPLLGADSRSAAVVFRDWQETTFLQALKSALRNAVEKKLARPLPSELPPLEGRDLHAVDLFADTVGQEDDPLASLLRERLSPAILKDLGSASRGDPQGPLAGRIAGELNRVLEDPALYTDERFSTVALSDEAQRLAASQAVVNPVHLNRMLLEQALPGVIARGVFLDESSPLDEYLQQCNRAIRGPVFLILDQFEEYFLYHLPAEGDGGFEAELARAVNRPDVHVNLLLSLREDSLDKLDRFQGRIPNILGNMLRLEHLDVESARKAVTGPLARYNELVRQGLPPVEIEPELVEAILTQVARDRIALNGLGPDPVPSRQTGGCNQIETPFLQMVLARLWEEERIPQSLLMRADTLTALGGAQNIVQAHVTDVLDQLDAKDAALAACIFRYLVTPSGGKIAHKASDLAELARLSDTEREAVLEPFLHRLGDARILRCTDAESGRYELYHDVLAPGILRWLGKYQAQMDAEERRRKEAEVRDREELLARQKQKGVLIARLSAGLGLVSLLSVAAVVLWLRADAETVRANRQTREANTQRDIAERRGKVILAQTNALKLQADELKRRADLLTDKNRKLTLARDAAESLRKSAESLAIEKGRLASQARRLAEQLDQTLSESQSRELAVMAAAREPQSPRQAVALAALGFDRSQTQEAIDALRAALLPAQRATRWQRIDSEERASLRSRIAHTAPVRTVAFSPDGRTLLTASDDGTARIWDAVTHTTRHIMQGHRLPIRSAAFSPDGSMVVTVAGDPASEKGDSFARVYRAETGAPLYAVRQSGQPLYTASFSQDGRYLITGGQDRSAHVWNAANGRSVCALKGHSKPVQLAVISPNGRLAATESSDSTARVWELPSGRPLLVLTGLEGPVPCLAFSRDNRYLATEVGDETRREYGCRLWPLRDIPAVGAPPLTLDPGPLLGPHRDGVSAVAFSADGRRLLTASRDATAQLWNVSNPERPVRLAVLTGHEFEIYSASFSPDGRYIVTASEDDTARLYDGESGSFIRALSGHGDSVTMAAFSPDSRHVATASKDETARIWDVRDEAKFAELGVQDASAISRQSARSAAIPRERLPQVLAREPSTSRSHGARVNLTAFSPRSGRWLLTVGADNQSRIWDLVSRRNPLTLSGPTAQVLHAAFSPDETLLAVCSRDGTLWVWRAADGRPLWHTTVPSVNGRPTELRALAFSPNSRLVAAGGSDRLARAWEARTGRVAGASGQHEGDVTAVAFSPDGAVLASGSTDRKVRIWETASWRLFRLLPHDSPVEGIRFSHDGLLLAAAGGSTQRIWRWRAQRPAGSSTPAAQVTLHTRTPAASVEFSADDRQAVATEMGGAASVFDVRTGSQLLRTEDRRTRPARRPGACTSVLSPDGKLAASAVDENTVGIWETATGRQIALLPRQAGLVTCVQFSPDGRLVAISSSAGTVQTYRTSDGGMDSRYDGHQRTVNTAAFSSDGRYLVTAGDDRTVRIWPVKAEERARAFGPFDSPVRAAKFSPDGRQVLVTLTRSAPIAIDSLNGQITARMQGPGGAALTAEFNAGGTKVAGASMSGLRIWNSADGALLRTFTREMGFKLARFLPDGRHVVTAGYDREVRLWDTEQAESAQGPTSRLVARLPGGVTDAASSPDGLLIASCGTGATAYVTDLRAQRMLTASLDSQGARSVQFGPDGRTLLVDGAAGIQRVFATARSGADASKGNSGSALALLAPPYGAARVDWRAVFSPQGKFILTANADGQARLWSSAQIEHDDASSTVVPASDDGGPPQQSSTSTSNLAAILTGHRGAATALAFSPDGRLAAVGGADGNVLIYLTEECAGPAVLRRIAEQHRTDLSAEDLNDLKRRKIPLPQHGAGGRRAARSSAGSHAELRSGPLVAHRVN